MKYFYVSLWDMSSEGASLCTCGSERKRRRVEKKEIKGTWRLFAVAVVFAIFMDPPLPSSGIMTKPGGLERRRVGREPGNVRRSDSLGPAPHGRELHLAHPPLAGAAAQHGESAPLGLQCPEGERPRGPGAKNAPVYAP